MYISARSMATYPSATEDCNIGDNKLYLLLVCDSFRYLGTLITPNLEISFDTDPRIRAATRF
jgi:hypothetical protein